MLSGIYIACIDDIEEDMPEWFTERLMQIIEEPPVNYRRHEDQLRHQMGLFMASTIVNHEQIRPLTVSRNIYGKPYFKEFPRFQFNISHSGKYVACAVSEKAIGVDIQELTDIDRNSWHLFMSKRELHNCSSAEQALFLWSAKEAVSKCLGYGFMKPPSDLVLSDLMLFDNSNPTLLCVGNAKLYLWQQIYNTQYVLSICTRTDEQPQIRFSVLSELSDNLSNLDRACLRSRN